METWPADLELWFPLNVVAGRFQRAPSVIKRLVYAGEVSAKKQGKLLLVRPLDIQKYYESLPNVTPRESRGDDRDASEREVSGSDEVARAADLRPRFDLEIVSPERLKGEGKPLKRKAKDEDNVIRIHPSATKRPSSYGVGAQNMEER